MPRVVVCLMLLVLAFSASSPAFAADPTPDGQDDLPTNVERAKVIDVVDGDTITVEIDGEEATVRLIGIDTPETVDPTTPDECYGAEASDHATGLLDGRTVWLETDVSDTDRYDRLLRSVWFQGKRDGQYYLANEILVRRGYAVVSTYPPDVAYVDRLTAAQDLAVAEAVGLWPGCGGADTPADQAAQEPAFTDCAIFISYDAAQQYYTDNPTVAQALDPDGDGIACGVEYRAGAAPVPAEGVAVGSAPGSCDPSYPTLCLPVGSPDIDCPQVGAANFTVLPPDPHGFDRDVDGIGCES